MENGLISCDSCDNEKVVNEYRLIKEAVSGLKSFSDYEMNILVSLIFNQDQLVGE